MAETLVALDATVLALPGLARPNLSLAVETDLSLAKLHIHGPSADVRFVNMVGAVPPAAGQQVDVDGLTIAWLAPGEWLICGDGAKVSAWLSSVEIGTDEAALALDITHGRAIFLLKGSDARTVLGAHCPLDLADRQFRVGSVARSILGDTTMFIARLPDLESSPRFRVIVDQTMANYAARILACG